MRVTQPGSPIIKAEQPMPTKNLNKPKGSNLTNSKPIASLFYATEGRGTDGVADDNSNVTCLCSYLVDKSFSTVLLRVYRLSFHFSIPIRELLENLVVNG